MALIQLKTKASLRELRQFGCLWLPLFCAVLGVLAWRQPGRELIAYALGGVAAASALAGALRPSLIRPIFVGLIYLTAPIGWVISYAVMVLVYYGVLTPIGLLLRAFGRDTISRGFDAHASSYWAAPEGEKPLQSYFKQF
ncbi:MAG TPA: SxtJ family membrane protein [Myxococcota bacterium]|nr:SxtJ family membrane protein [Myxococcota bacterium]